MKPLPRGTFLAVYVSRDIKYLYGGAIWKHKH
nr:MAG TPA: hypothetical protein [Caudoviricetes sp.]